MLKAKFMFSKWIFIYLIPLKFTSNHKVTSHCNDRKLRHHGNILKISMHVYIIINSYVTKCRLNKIVTSILWFVFYLF